MNIFYRLTATKSNETHHKSSKNSNPEKNVYDYTRTKWSIWTEYSISHHSIQIFSFTSDINIYVSLTI